MMRFVFLLYVFATVFFGSFYISSQKNEQKKRLVFRNNIQVSKRDALILRMSTVLLFQCSAFLFLIWLGEDIPRALLFSFCVSSIPEVIKFTNRRSLRNKLDSQIEPFLQNLSSALYVNHSFRQALREALDEADAPLRNEIYRVLIEIEAGAAQNDALHRFAGRIGDEVLNMAIDGIAICSETGGELPGYFDRLVELKRERRRINGRIAAMSSQQKTTARIVTLLPVAFLGVIGFVNPSYLLYFKSSIGVGVISYSTASILIGFVVMNKMTKLLPNT